MKYINQINAFWNWVKLNDLPSRAGYLYFAILDCANTAGWKGEFNAPNSTLQAMAGLDKNGLVRCRNALVQAGLIKYQQGKRGASGIYSIIPLYDTNNDTNNDTNSEPVAIPIANQSGYQNRVHTKSKSKSKSIITPLSPNGDIPPEGERPRKHKYGEYKNVLLADDEIEKLKAEYTDYLDRIERLSSYIASTGKAYKSHYATIRNWARADAEKGRSNGAKQGSSPQRNAEETPRYGTWL
jgi:hypothetical protein